MADHFDNDIDDSFSSRVRDSHNTTSTTTNNTVGVDLDDVGNTDASTNGSGNLAADLDNVGNVDSHDSSTGVTGSFNDWSDNSVNDWSDNSSVDNSDNSDNDASDNSMTDNSDHSVNGSYNDESSSLIEGSYNSYMDESVDDHSVDVGTRDYSTGIGSIDLGGGGGGGGDVWVNNQNTIVDQSSNGYGGSGDGYAALSGAEGGSSAVVASGSGAIAAGNDVKLSQSVDHSSNISAHGDVNLGNETRITTISDSYNETTDASSWTDSSTHLDVDGSYNTDTASWSATNSFNDELTSHTESTWDVDADVIWGSEDAAIDVAVPTVDDGMDS